MRQSIVLLRAVSALLLCAVALGVNAQHYPSRDIRFIVPFTPGGSVGSITKQFTDQLEKALGGNLNVESMPGGSGTIGIGAVVRAKPDGYTIGFAPSEALAYQPLINKELPYHSVEDYVPIVKLGDRPSVLYVRADAPWKTFDEFIADAKRRPGKIRVSVPGLGTLSDLLVQQLNKVAGIRLVTVPFSGGGSEAVIPLLGGRVEANMGSVAASIGQVRSGSIRALAAFQKGRNQILPEAVSVNDAGYDVSLRVSFYVIAPKGMPKDVEDRLVQASLDVVRSKEFLEFSKQNDFLSDPKGPVEIREELTRYGRGFADLIKFIEQN